MRATRPPCSPFRRVRWLGALLVAAGCVEPNAQTTAPAVWSGDVSAILGTCTPCHSPEGASPDLTTWLGAVECSPEGEPWASAGDAGSPLLRALERPDHAALLGPAERDRLQEWIVERGLAFSSTLPHPTGFAAPSGGPMFHGIFLRETNYFAAYAPAETEGSCARCHAAPRERGGATPCTTCHPSGFGEETCDSCHGAGGDPRPMRGPCDSGEAGARIGAHALHRDRVSSAYFPAVQCALCHVVPRGVHDEGHLSDATPSRAEVRFDTTLEPRLAGATYDAATQTCSVALCHSTTAVRWTKTSTGATCTSCHGNPPPSHSQSECSLCHQAALDPRGEPTGGLHLDGIVQAGRECTDCHTGGPTAPALHGDPGAHEGHLAPGRFASAVPCESCHLVPAEVGSVGHIDSALPPEVTLATSRATGGGRRAPRWDHEALRCSDVACHGAGLDGGTYRTPAWTSSSTVSIECGACHGLPPRFVRDGLGLHLPTGTGDCGACHQTPAGDPITRGLDVISEAGKASHIDGCVNLVGACP